MFKHIATLFISCTMIFGCAVKQTDVIKQQDPVTIVQHVEQPTPRQNTTFVGTSWSIDIPSSTWLKMDEKPELEVGNLELLVRSKQLFGDLPIIMGVTVIPLPEELKDERSFVEFVETHDSNREDIAIIKYDVGTLDGSPGSTSAFILVDDNLLQLQLTTARGRTGYIVKCGGLIESHEAVIKKCTETMQTFKVNR